MQNRITDEISHMVEKLREPDQRLVLEIIRRFIPDDIATPDDLAAIDAAKEDSRLGLTVKHDDIDWN